MADSDRCGRKWGECAEAYSVPHECERPGGHPYREGHLCGCGLCERLGVTFTFLWYDIWVGAYWDRINKTLYLCPLPMCVFRIGRIMLVSRMGRANS